MQWHEGWPTIEVAGHVGLILHRSSLRGGHVMRTRLRIAHLADHPEAIPVIRRWFEVEWAAYYGPGGPGDAEQDLLAYSSRGKLPVGLIALYDDALCGIAALKAHSLSTHTHLGPWAAAGFVLPPFRGRGIGSSLVGALKRWHEASATQPCIVQRPPRWGCWNATDGNSWSGSDTTAKRCPSIKRRSNNMRHRTHHPPPGVRAGAPHR